MTYALYVGSFLGAVSLLLMMPRQNYTPVKLGALLGAATLGGVWLFLAKHYAQTPGVQMAYYYIFSFLAIGSAARVITHRKPVFSALWFVMVVLASSGLFLLVDAEFVAFAMVIIYGGAILVTYVFVIMLASQSVDPAHEETAPGYDRIAREPAACVAAGFLLLALLLSITFRPIAPNPAYHAASDASIIARLMPERTIGKYADQGQPFAQDAGRLENVEHVGLDLFQGHPMGLELAGVILLVSLVGAVVIARKHVDMEV
jgi:NADH-quinone oxidoreductase subunit J